ncbi:CPBP family intramembrane glutamic endopeptidase [Pengzhenrongella frigida]|uniref:CPBP family intramembrane metalloprotease n=1 Tax=Pengzhenrongella frigida TaxID=1259133 RepID=A0A4Q5MWF0_9MICO|nr:CPBP family intramembrane glutamic endopeptidase [Cellulomonas sp. HLT2-17]RYV49900.1 CPBP family intramembrane metalloprotease [Cellulomonas sp. HLT2-17]
MRLHPLVDAAGVHVLRFLTMLAVLAIAGAVGIDGWYLGLVANTAVSILAVVLMTRRRLWRSSGATVAWRSWAALVVLIPLAVEAISWALPSGLTERAPGYPLWALTLVLVGFNEELISRGVVLSRLREAYRPAVAVTFTGALFGLQHLSAFALTSRAAGDILGNVALSAIFGFALAAFQWRFRWIWPLIVVHATADFTTLLATEPLPDVVVGAAHVMLLTLGVVVPRWPHSPRDTRSAARLEIRSSDAGAPRPIEADPRRSASLRTGRTSS